MRIAVMGGGAMGGLWAGRLAQTHEVIIIDVAEPLVEHINTSGLTVEEPTGQSVTTKPSATTSTNGVAPVDVLYFFVKAHHTEGAARLGEQIVSAETIVVTLQNGWGNADVLARQYPAGQLVAGVTYNSATTRDLGQVAHTGAGPTYVGPYESPDLSRARKVAELQDKAGLPTSASADIRVEIWKKLILNAVTLPTSALTRLPAGALNTSQPMRHLLRELTGEAVAVARAMGLDIESQERFDRIDVVLAAAGPGKSSMLQDVEAQRKTEIEVVNGAVVREAEQLGLDVPLNRAMVALIEGLERSWQA
ncbi:MAG: ketopantoate reductase family protein [Acidimicrobiia bacterium]